MRKAIKIQNKTLIGVPKRWVRLATPNHTTMAYDKLPNAEHFIDGWKEVITPVYNPNTQYLGELIENESNFEYEVIALSDEIIEQNIINNSEAVKQQYIEETINQQNEDVIVAGLNLITDPEDLLAAIDVFPLWAVDNSYVLDDKIKHPKDGVMKLYKVNQPSLIADVLYPPSAAGTESLYSEIVPPGAIAEWVKPTGAQNAYSIGDKVAYNEQIWISKINGNTTVPDGDVPYNRYWEPFTE